VNFVNEKKKKNGKKIENLVGISEVLGNFLKRCKKGPKKGFFMPKKKICMPFCS
jgi:hypothetical protein